MYHVLCLFPDGHIEHETWSSQIEFYIPNVCTALPIGNPALNDRTVNSNCH